MGETDGAGLAEALDCLLRMGSVAMRSGAMAVGLVAARFITERHWMVES